MANKIEIFTNTCDACKDTISLINHLASESTQGNLTILDISKPENAARAKELKIEKYPAVILDGQLHTSCPAKEEQAGCTPPSSCPAGNA